MSFLGDKKREHESVGVAAYDRGDLGLASFHYFKAAEYGIRLAEESDGRVRDRYVDDAFELIELGEKLKAKAGRGSTRKSVPEGSAEDEPAPSGGMHLTDRPSDRLADVVGLDAVKAELREKVIEPFQHPELFERFQLKVGGGVLMFGPPGNGKTFIARAIAGELDAAFFVVNTAEIKDKYVGETEKKLQRLFEEARAHPRAVLFLDEVDHLLGRRGNRKIGAVAQFLSLMDGFTKNKNVLLVLAATNKPWSIEDAVLRPGRLGTHVYVGPPDAPARAAIIGYQLKGVPFVDGLDLAALAARTEAYSGADLAEVCDRAKRAAKNRQVSSGQDEVVTLGDFDTALAAIKPSVTAQQIQEFEAWMSARAKPPGSDEEEG